MIGTLRTIVATQLKSGGYVPTGYVLLKGADGVQLKGTDGADLYGKAS